MTVQEFSNEFDTLYNNISNNSAPGLDGYDKSVFLTKAQEEIVESYIEPMRNRFNIGFDENEKRKRDLSNLIQQGFTTTEIVLDNNLKVNSQSKIFEIPADVMYIIDEYVGISESNEAVSIKPATYDEIDVLLRDSFRKPDFNNIEKYAFRLDKGTVENKRAVELILFNATINIYRYFYLKNPSPIIIEDLDTIQSGLTIDGISAVTECELDRSIHREILDRAVELALEAYQQPRLQSKLTIDSRGDV